MLGSFRDTDLLQIPRHLQTFAFGIRRFVRDSPPIHFDLVSGFGFVRIPSIPVHWWLVSKNRICSGLEIANFTFRDSDLSELHLGSGLNSRMDLSNFRVSSVFGIFASDQIWLLKIFYKIFRTSTSPSHPATPPACALLPCSCCSICRNGKKPHKSPELP